MHIPVLRQAVCMLPWRSHVPQAPASTRCAASIMTAAWKLLFADKSDDVFGRLHGCSRDVARAVGAVNQDRIDVGGVGDQPFHLGADRRQLGDAQLYQGILE